MPDSFETRQLPTAVDAVAPDGSDVRVLLSVEGCSMAQFSLPPGQTSVAVRHRTISEIWCFVSGHGDMWRSDGDREETVAVQPGTAITIPVGTAFQFRSTTGHPLVAVGATAPPWPGAGEAEIVEGRWTPTVEAGPV